MLLAGVLLSFSKIMQTVAFFMPLKVLIVLSAGEESKYSSYFKSWLTADQFLAIIIVMVPVSYLLYIFFGIAHRRYADRDMKRQVARAKSEKYGDRKLRVIKKIHPRLIRIWADMCVVVLIILIISIIQARFAAVLLILIGMNLGFFNAWVFGREESVRLTPLRLHPKQFVEYITSINYLLVFSVLAVGVYYHSIGIVTALLALLLSRLCLMAVQRISLESRTLQNNLEIYWNSL